MVHKELLQDLQKFIYSIVCLTKILKEDHMSYTKRSTLYVTETSNMLLPVHFKDVLSLVFVQQDSAHKSPTPSSLPIMT